MIKPMSDDDDLENFVHRSEFGILIGATLGMVAALRGEDRIRLINQIIRRLETIRDAVLNDSDKGN